MPNALNLASWSDETGAIHMQVRAGLSQVQLCRTPDPGFKERTERALGFLPDERVGATSGTHVLALTVGPGRWLIVGDAETQMFERLEQAGLRVIDLGNSRTVIRVAGPAAADLLAKGCGLDFDLQSFRPGTCAASLLSQIPCLFHRLDHGFDLYLPRSLALSAWEWLCEGAFCCSFEATFQS